MSEPKNLDSVPLNSHAIPVLRKSQSWFLIGSMFLVSSLILAARVPYKPHSLERSLLSDQQWELVGSGQLKGPEDVAYHSRSKLIYTGCSDGWIKHVTVNKSAADTVVKNWVNTGGRPLGIAFGRHNDVIVADPVKGLLNITQRGEVKVLTVGNRDKKFKLIDSVVVAKNGMVYFTEASYKYSFDEYLLDILEGQPHGRLWSYNPTANKTRVLLTDLYFTNGMALSPDQDFLIFCETTKKRCRKYYIQGGKKGSVKNFTDLPGYPDNIRYAGEGKFLITLVLPSTGRPGETVLNNHFARKFLRMNTTEYIVQPHYEAANSTDVVFLVDTKGKVNARYVGPKMSLISSATRIGNYIYCGSPINMYMGRLNLQKYSSKLLATHCTDDDEPSLQ